MKTEQEIKAWLEIRRWFNKFKRNLEKEAKLHQDLPKFTDDVLEGRWGYMTISGAFRWRNTSEGENYWKRRDIEFLAWLDNRSETETEEMLPRFWLFAGIFVCGLSFGVAMFSALTGDWILSIVYLINSVLLAISSIRFLKDVW